MLRRLQQKKCGPTQLLYATLKEAATALVERKRQALEIEKEGADCDHEAESSNSIDTAHSKRGPIAKPLVTPNSGPPTSPSPCKIAGTESFSIHKKSSSQHLAGRRRDRSRESPPREDPAAHARNDLQH